MNIHDLRERESYGKSTSPNYCCFLLSFIRSCISLDTITPSESLKDSDPLISIGGTFDLGFFNPKNPKGYNLGFDTRMCLLK